MRTPSITVALVAALAAPPVVQAADGPGWRTVDPSVCAEAAKAVRDWIAAGSPAAPPAAPAKDVVSALAVGNDADQIGPEIETLARGLLNDPVRIFAYCANNIEYEHYFGCKKGATLTLLEGSGNSFDTAALMVALLRASGYTASYRYGPRIVSGQDLARWLGLWYTGDPGQPYPQYTDSQFRTAYGYGSDPRSTPILRFLQNCYEFSFARGFPAIVQQDIFGYSWLIPHVTVQFQAGGRTYDADPSFKLLDAPAAMPDWQAGLQYNRTALLAAVGGTEAAPGSVSGLDEAKLATNLTTCTTNLSQWIRHNAPDRPVADFLQERRTRKAEYLSLAQIPAFQYATGVSWLATTTWSAIPTAWMSTLRITFGQSYSASSNSFATTYHDVTLNMAALSGKKLALTFSGTGTKGALCLDDTLMAEFVIAATPFQIRLEAGHPIGRYNLSSGAFTDNGSADQREVKQYRCNDQYAYVFLYGFNGGGRLLNQRRAKLEAYRSAGFQNSSREITTEVLNIMGLTWLLQTDMNFDAICGTTGVSSLHHHRFGRMSQEDAYYIDVGLQFAGEWSRVGDHPAKRRAFQFGGLLDSALEHGVIEQLQGQGVQAVSTIRILQLANKQGTKVYRAHSGNWSSIRPVLATARYSAAALDTIGAGIAAGATVLLPENPKVPLGSWKGTGYASMSADVAEMAIDGGYNGGYLADPGTVSPAPFYTDTWFDPAFADMSTSQLESLYASLAAGRAYGSDPVDMGSGAFTFDKTHFVVGNGQLPRGISFSTHYNSNDTASFGAAGWRQSLNGVVEERSAAAAGLGAATPRQMAPYLAGLVVARDLFCNGTTAKEWETAALAINWVAEQLRYNGVSVAMGAQTIEFLRMPDGSFEPPPGTTLSLARNATNQYVATERNGNAYTFGASGDRLSAVTDPYGKTATFAYDSNGNLSQVKDCFGRIVDFQYGSTTKVIDRSDADRTVEFAWSAANNTLTVTDPEGKPWKFLYTGTRITSIVDPKGRTTVANTYDSQGRVIEQRSAGAADKTWKLHYSGYETTQIDPVDGATTFHFDERGRPTGTTNALGKRDWRFYDGQDRVVATTDAVGHKTFIVYDRNHNPIEISDPKWNPATQAYDLRTGRVSTKTWDASFHLVAETNYSGKTTTYTYNDKHQILTVTDARGIVVTTNTYDANGNLSTVKDAAANTTTYTYDTRGNVAKITHPNGDTESFTYNERGDALTHVDGRSRTTSFTYNQRRQPVRTTLPWTAFTENTYDECGDLWKTADPNGRVTTYTYSATGKLLTTELPATSAGTSKYTNAYDARDWLSSVTDPLDRMTSFAYDAAGRRVSATDPLGRTTTYGYDDAGRQVSVTDPLLRTTTTAYDDRGQPIKVTDPAGNKVEKTFDASGNLTTLRNRLERNYTFTFDPTNRPLTSATPRGAITTRTWNTQGLPGSVKEPSGQTETFTYDARGRLAKRVDGDAREHAFTYDANGNATKITDGAKEITRDIDDRDWLKGYRDSDTGQGAGYGYDNAGNVTSIDYPDGKKVNYTYDQQNRLTTVTDWAGRVTTCSYDKAGQLVKVQRPNGTVRNLTYDAGGRITRLDDRSASGLPLLVQLFNYDAAGQLINEFRAPLAPLAAEPAAAATYDVDNRLASFDGVAVTHDADGNMTSGPLLGTSAVTYTFDAANRLTAAGGVQYGYDAVGNRTTVTVGGATTRYTFDLQAALPRVLERTKPDGSKTFYVYGLDLLYEVDGAGATKTYHADSRGSTAMLTADDGVTVTDEVHYTTYGAVARRTGATDTPFLFCGTLGVMTDPNGLLNMRARCYNPKLMRFVSADPIGFDGGLNWYAYCGGNPVSLVDPSGLWTWTQTYGVLNALGGAAEFATGVVAGVSTSWTGIGAVAGGLVAVHGMDAFLAGINQAWSGVETDTLTSQAIQGLGLSRDTANIIDAGISIAGSAGAGMARGGALAGAKGAGLEFSHWIPRRFGGPRSIWNGNFVSTETHALSDPYRYRFMQKAWKALNEIHDPATRQWERIPEVYKGAAAGALIGLGGAPDQFDEEWDEGWNAQVSGGKRGT
jgi:RHS repeat-associated protein